MQALKRRNVWRERDRGNSPWLEENLNLWSLCRDSPVLRKQFRFYTMAVPSPWPQVKPYEILRNVSALGR